MDGQPPEAADTVKREVKLQLNVTMMIMIIDHTKDNIDDDEYDDDDDDDDIYIMMKCLSVCMSRFCLFHFLPFLDTFGSRNKRKSV